MTLPDKIRVMPTREQLLTILGGLGADALTASKTITVMERDGFKITGFVLAHPETSNRAIVELSAVRWLSKAESWWMMHESNSPIFEQQTKNDDE